MKFCIASLFSIAIFLCSTSIAQTRSLSKRIVVDGTGKGDFQSIQAALNSLSDSSAEQRVIFIKNGTYNEKIYIEKHRITLQGESREKTIITQAIARDAWRCRHVEDWGVATMNVDGNDITLMNLTVINNYGQIFEENVSMYCPVDTVTRRKTITAASHQMAVRTMNATRLKAVNCRFVAFGGDTVSPWNVEAGMFYFKDCIMEGGVDFYCPRGWAYAENCTFITKSGDAAIWHDGSRHQDSKTVLKNCFFEGYDGFKLGRYHRDAQFYLINCMFAANMSNTPLYWVTGSAPIKWGHRVYYFNCHKKNGDYNWHKDNLSEAAGVPSASQIDAYWVFKDRWKPV